MLSLTRSFGHVYCLNMYFNEKKIRIFYCLRFSCKEVQGVPAREQSPSPGDAREHPQQQQQQVRTKRSNP